MALNLEKQLVFYGAYHNNPVNIGVHVLCVPLLLWTGFLMGTTSPSVELPANLAFKNLPLNMGTAAMLVYGTLFVLLEPVAGGLLAPLLIASAAFANHLTSEYGMTAVYWAVGVHIVCWLAQFVGHGVYEGRAPALLDNLVQAIFLAPLFVWLEILFHFGYRPALRKRLNNAVGKEIASFRKEKAAAARAQQNGNTKVR